MKGEWKGRTREQRNKWKGSGERGDKNRGGVDSGSG